MLPIMRQIINSYPPKLNPLQINRGGALPIDNNGDTLFLRNSNGGYLLKSLNGWKTTGSQWKNINTAYGGKVLDSNGVALSDSKILFSFKHNSDVAQDGWYILEDQGEGVFTFTKVLSMTIGDPSSAFGKDKYPLINPTMILLTEYGAKTSGAYAKLVHLSVDSGATWRTIFELPEELAGNTHAHSAHYDPYGDRIWVVNGDEGASNVWYSDDWRNATPTWTKLWETGTAPVQFTSIYSTPTRILFGTDGIGVNGIWAINRGQAESTVHPVFILDQSIATMYVGRGFKQNPYKPNEIYVVMSGNSISDYPGDVILGSKNGGEKWYKLYRDKPGVLNSFTNLWIYQNSLIWWVGANKSIATIRW